MNSPSAARITQAIERVFPRDAFHVSRNSVGETFLCCTSWLNGEPQENRISVYDLARDLESELST